MHTEIDDALWNDFHRYVNMTSRELEDWLRESASGEDAEALPDEAGSLTGQHVLHILSKRREDLTADDARVMRNVVRRIADQVDEEDEPMAGGEAGWRRTVGRGTGDQVDEEEEPMAGETHWRHRLMTLGHDPLKPRLS